jgi:hypothetical protein
VPPFGGFVVFAAVVGLAESVGPCRRIGNVVPGQIVSVGGEQGIDLPLRARRDVR